MTATLLSAALIAALAAAPQPRAVDVGLSVALVTASQPELRRYGPQFRGLHMVAAVSGWGEVRGALLKRTGATRCTFRGVIDTYGDVTLLVSGC